MKRFEIWWSPMGKQNSRKVIEAKTKEEAKQAAFAEMRRHGDCGAWGADLVQDGMAATIRARANGEGGE